MLIFRLLASIALLATFAARGENTCNWLPYAESSALEEICPFSEGLAAIKIGDAWGYVDRQGKLAIAPSFAEAKGFSENYAGVAKGGKWGFIDRSGKLVVPMSYIAISNFSEGLASVTVDEKTGYIDAGGQLVIQYQFSQAGDFKDGVAVVKTDEGYALINKRGEFVHRFTKDISVDAWGRPGGRLLATRTFAPELASLDGRRRNPPTEVGNYPNVAGNVYFPSGK